MTTLTTNRRIVLAGALLMSAALARPFGSQAATATPAPKAPSVNTGGFVVVNPSSVALEGSVNPRGLATVYYFQFGTTTRYGARTSPASAGSGVEAVKVSQTIAGLSPGATYHYRLIARNAAGTTKGEDETFTTKKMPFTFKLAATPHPAVFGSSISVRGVMSGTGAANHEVVLQSDPFPYRAGFKSTGRAELTSATGRFSFSVADLKENTKFRVATVGVPAASSHVVRERVAVRVSLHLGSAGRPGFVRLYGTVAPAETGALVAFQLLQPGLPLRGVGRTVVQRATAGTSRFSHVVRIRSGGLYRAVVLVNNNRQVPGHSQAIMIG